MNQSVSDKCWADSKTKFNKEFSALFYILWPKEETKDNAYDVPDYEVLVCNHANDDRRRTCLRTINIISWFPILDFLC